MQLNSTAIERPSVRVRNLSHRYAKSWAIKDISIEVGGGGVVALLGANGAGKSTLMNILCGCLTHTAGDVLLDEINIKKKPMEFRKQLGFLPQQAPVAAELTIGEFLQFCAELQGIEPKSRASSVERVMALCDLEQMRNRLIGSLSGGYRQRVGIAQAVIHEPPIVVLDEPTVGLDPKQIVGLRALIKTIASQSTVLFSTHILSEVEMLCRTVIMISGGRLKFTGSVDDFRSTASENAVLLVAKELPNLSTIKEVFHTADEVTLLDQKTLRISHCTGRDYASVVAREAIERDWGFEECFSDHQPLEAAFLSMI